MLIGHPQVLFQLNRDLVHEPKEIAPREAPLLDQLAAPHVVERNHDAQAVQAAFDASGNEVLEVQLLGDISSQSERHPELIGIAFLSQTLLKGFVIVDSKENVLEQIIAYSERYSVLEPVERRIG